MKKGQLLIGNSRASRYSVTTQGKIVKFVRIAQGAFYDYMVVIDPENGQQYSVEIEDFDILQIDNDKIRGHYV